MDVTEFPIEQPMETMETEVRRQQREFMAHINNRQVAYNTVEKSYRGCFVDIKSC